VLKNFIVLTHPPPAATSPARPESAETASSPRDSPYLDKAAGEKATEAYLRRYVEEGFEPRTTLRNFFSTLLCR
jgi:hypothetical protein